MGPGYWLGGPHSPSSSHWFDWVATPTSYWKNVPPLQPLVRLVEPPSHPPFQPLVGFIDPSPPTERTSGLRPGRTSPERFPSRGRRCVLLGQSGSWRCWAGHGWHRNAPGYSLCSGAPAATGSLSSLHILNLGEGEWERGRGSEKEQKGIEEKKGSNRENKNKNKLHLEACAYILHLGGPGIKPTILMLQGPCSNQLSHTWQQSIKCIHEAISTSTVVTKCLTVTRPSKAPTASSSEKNQTIGPVACLHCE